MIEFYQEDYVEGWLPHYFFSDVAGSQVAAVSVPLLWRLECVLVNMLST